MSDISEIRKMLSLNENFHMCDVSNISPEGIHLISWDVDVPKSDFEEIIVLIYKDGFNIEGFELLEIPHPDVFCFGNKEKEQYFDVVKLGDSKYQFSYVEDFMNKLANSIAEAVSKYEMI